MAQLSASNDIIFGIKFHLILINLENTWNLIQCKRLQAIFLTFLDIVLLNIGLARSTSYYFSSLVSQGPKCFWMTLSRLTVTKSLKCLYSYVYPWTCFEGRPQMWNMHLEQCIWSFWYNENELPCGSLHNLDSWLIQLITHLTHVLKHGYISC